MVECKSYVIDEHKTFLIGKQKDLFIPLQDNQKNNEKLKKILSNEYIAGYISLEINGVEVLGEGYWDDIFCLWGYFIDALSQIILDKKRKVSFWFPDQPIMAELELDDYQIKLIINEKSYKCMAHEFISVILAEAKCFWNRLNDFNRKLDLTNEIVLVEKLLIYLQKLDKLK